MTEHEYECARRVQELKGCPIYKEYESRAPDGERIPDPTFEGLEGKPGQIRSRLGSWMQSVQERVLALRDQYPDVSPSSSSTTERQSAGAVASSQEASESPESSDGGARVSPIALRDDRWAMLQEAKRYLPSGMRIPEPNIDDKDFTSKLERYMYETANAFRLSIMHSIIGRGMFFQKAHEPMARAIAESGAAPMIIVDGQSYMHSHRAGCLDAHRIRELFSRANPESYVVVVHRDKPGGTAASASEYLRAFGEVDKRHISSYGTTGAVIYAMVRFTTTMVPGSKPSRCSGGDGDTPSHDKCRADDFMIHWFVKTVNDAWGGAHPGIYIVSNNSCYSHGRRKASEWASPKMRDIPEFTVAVSIGNKNRITKDCSREVYVKVCPVDRGCIARVMTDLEGWRVDEDTWTHVTADAAAEKKRKIVARCH